MMESVLVCLMLLSVSGLQWDQLDDAPLASTVQVRVGEDATLQCPLLDASNATTTTTTPAAPSTLSWYKKAAGQSPKMLLSIRLSINGIKYGSGVSRDKVSAAADGSLLLRASQRSDSAVYYCGISQGDKGRRPQGNDVSLV